MGYRVTCAADKDTYVSLPQDRCDAVMAVAIGATVVGGWMGESESQ